MIDILKKNKKIIVIIWLCILLAIVMLINNNHNQLKVIKQVELTSGRRNYENNEEGAWNLTKTAKWIAFRKAQIEFNFDSRVKERTLYTIANTAGELVPYTTVSQYKDLVRRQDILLVIDTSSAIDGEKFDKLKSATKDYIEYKLSRNRYNRIGIITYNNNSNIAINLTSNIDDLKNKIDALTTGGSNNYYQGLLSIESILNNYFPEYIGEMTVVFLTGGYPNQDTPLEVGEYSILKEKYSYTQISGVQYEMGNDVVEPLINVSDKQYIASENDLKDILIEATDTNVETFEKIEVIDYINDDFKVESENDIKPSIGTVKLENDHGKQKIIWTIPDDTLRTGKSANLIIDVTLQEASYDKEYVITNEKEEITVKLPEEESETQKTTIRPTLKNASKVIYNGNSPSDCVVSGVPNKEYYSPLEPVTIAENVKCDGYNFKKWDINNDDLVMINKNTFLMPEEDVELTAKWGKLELSLTMNGKINETKEAVEYLLSKANDASVTNYEEGNKGEMFTFSHPRTEQTDALTDYRYIGSSPNNHVYFNCTDESDKSTCEVWRIIGIFNVSRTDPEDATKTINENRIKLVRGSLLANRMQWDSNNTNNWPTSSLQIYLNGSYYENLSSVAKLQIDNTKFYLGGRQWVLKSPSWGSTEDMYAFERGSTLYDSSNPINWEGKVAIMYPSDNYYTYANNVEKDCYDDPDKCYYIAPGTSSTGNYSYPETGWIYNSNKLEGATRLTTTWFISSNTRFPNAVYYVLDEGNVNMYNFYVQSQLGVRPVVYLKSGIKISGGSGTENSPYILE